MSPDYRTWPKAELHLHLEGTVEPGTILELDPTLEPAEVRASYEYGDFPGFLQCFKWISQRLAHPEDYALAARRCFERLEQENIHYAEITLSAGVVLWKRQNLELVFEACAEEADRTPVEVRWILDAVRQFPVEDAWQVAEFAARRQDRGVIAFGLGGDEARGPARAFEGVCGMARAEGLHLTLHAGESAGPESVWGALAVGSERIGHGIRAVEDPVLVRHLADRRIPLEVCISSNVATGVVPSFSAHPVRQLFDAGVPIVLNTDDPALFRTSLAREFELAWRHLGFTWRELESIAENGFQYAFCQPPVPARGRFHSFGPGRVLDQDC